MRFTLSPGTQIQLKYVVLSFPQRKSLNTDILPLTCPASFQPKVSLVHWLALLCAASQLCIAVYLKYVSTLVPTCRVYDLKPLFRFLPFKQLNPTFSVILRIPSRCSQCVKISTCLLIPEMQTHTAELWLPKQSRFWTCTEKQNNT